MYIAEYIKFMAGETHGRGPRGDHLRTKAKEQLLSSGWTFWKALKYDGRRELRYKTPRGTSYISLITACKAYHDNINNAATPPPPPRRKPVSKSNNTSRTASSRNSSNKKRTVSSTNSSSKKKTEHAVVANNCTNGGREEIETDDDCSDESTTAIDPPYAGECTRSKKRRRVSAIRADEALKRSTKKRKKASASPAASQERLVRPRPKDGETQAAPPLACQPSRARTILAVLMDKNILLSRDKLTYRRTRDGPPMKEGVVTGDGIRCMCGCGKVFTVAELEVHAVGGSTERPSARMFLKDGRSLSQCLVQLMRGDGSKNRGSPRVRLKQKFSDQDDSVCSVCADGGEMLLCDRCPSAFHHACVGLEDTPQGDWFCPSCRCAICESSEFEFDRRFTDKTVIYCDQCERVYHVGCIRSRGDQQLECCPEGPWLCSQDCSKIYQHLQGLVGRSIPTSVQGLSFTILRSSKLPEEEEAMAEEHGKLCMAFDVLHECFVTLIEPHTRSDLSEDIVFNRESWLRRLNFRGFYVIGLEKGGELITVGTLRTYGKKVAELPLVGTRFAHRRQGMCHLLMNELEKLLCELGVERLVLPAVPDLLQTWTGSFGFQVMNQSDKLEIAEHTILCFQGTTMCHKFINDASPERRKILEDRELTSSD